LSILSGGNFFLLSEDMVFQKRFQHIRLTAGRIIVLGVAIILMEILLLGILFFISEIIRNL
ncbi:hypothetical protein, partial [Yersinia pestis]|uniref:hypothetical protein n=1 Tax=Yersinia pestis TaxID=632 RepID=UPI001C1FD4A6